LQIKNLKKEAKSRRTPIGRFTPRFDNRLKSHFKGFFHKKPTFSKSVIVLIDGIDNFELLFFAH
jgi:hypothetical protein